MNAILADGIVLPWERWSDERKPGEYPLEALPSGWANARVTFEHSDTSRETRIEILNLSTRNRYLQEPMAMVAFKCAGLFLLVLPVYFLAYTAVHLIRLPVAPLVNLSPTLFFEQIWNIVRIPFYFIALESSALYGVFKPMEGRALFGEIESALHDGKNRRQSEQYQKKGTLNPLWDAVSSEQNGTSFFIGYCMQPIGNESDPHIKKVEVLPNPVP